MTLVPFLAETGRSLRSEPVPAVLIGVLLADALGWPRSEAPAGVEGDPADLINSLEIGEDGVVHLLGGADREHVGTIEAREAIRGGVGGLDEVLASSVVGALHSLAIVGGPVIPRTLEQSKFVGFVPAEAAEAVIDAVFQAGAGRIGNYDHCSFQVGGTGTFRGNDSSNPAVGERHKDERIPEIRFEVICPDHAQAAIIRSYLKAHPYETPAYDIVALATPGPAGAGRLVQLTEVMRMQELSSRLDSALGFDDVWLPVGTDTHDRAQHVAVTVGPLAELIPAFVHERPRPADIVICGSAEDWEVEVLRALGAAVAVIRPQQVVPPLRAAVASSLTRILGMAVKSAGRGAIDDAPSSATQEAQVAAPPAPDGQLFASSGVETDLALSFDGGSRGNPGPAAGAFVIFDPDGIEIERRGVLCGRATNNVAEWTGLLKGVERALEMGAKRLAIRGDSQLVIRQLLGEYRVKHPDLQPLHAQTIALLRQLDSWSAVHVLRGKNAEADALVNETLDAGRNLP